MCLESREQQGGFICRMWFWRSWKQRRGKNRANSQSSKKHRLPFGLRAKDKLESWRPLPRWSTGQRVVMIRLPAGFCVWTCEPSPYSLQGWPEPITCLHLSNWPEWWILLSCPSRENLSVSMSSATSLPLISTLFESHVTALIIVLDWRCH